MIIEASFEINLDCCICGRELEILDEAFFMWPMEEWESRYMCIRDAKQFINDKNRQEFLYIDHRE